MLLISRNRSPHAHHVVRVDTPTRMWGYVLHGDRPTIECRVVGTDGVTYMIALSDDDIDALNIARAQYHDQFPSRRLSLRTDIQDALLPELEPVMSPADRNADGIEIWLRAIGAALQISPADYGKLAGIHPVEAAKTLAGIRKTIDHLRAGEPAREARYHGGLPMDRRETDPPEWYRP